MNREFTKTRLAGTLFLPRCDCWNLLILGTLNDEKMQCRFSWGLEVLRYICEEREYGLAAGSWYIVHCRLTLWYMCHGESVKMHVFWRLVYGTCTMGIGLWYVNHTTEKW